MNNRILTVAIEDYVAAVVTGESSEFQSTEALKAMAVAARTYAAYMHSRHASRGFDFCATTHCQRFVQPAAARAVAASKATAGELLWFDNQPAMTLYTRSCGGTSEGMANFRYLVVHADPYCHSAWQWSGTAQQITQALKSSALDVPAQLHSIAIVGKTDSGRAQRLALYGSGQTRLISASSFRFAIGRALGWNTIQSELFSIPSAFVFVGAGEGHGMGLCQRGADQMGLQGKTYHDILAFYYPHTLPFPWTRLSGERLTMFTARPDADRPAMAIADRLLRDLPFPASPQIWVYPTIESFRNATAEPGWVAARTDGSKIEIQPTEVLQRHGALESTLRHEILHVSIQSAARPGLPLWFREGLVEWLTDHHPTNGSAAPNKQAMRQRQNQSQARSSYKAAENRVAALVHQYGQATVLSWLNTGLPKNLNY